MRFASFVLAVALTITLASAVEARPIRFIVWQPAPAPVVAAPRVTYTAPYWQQSHWIYGYLPYGYDAFAYPWSGLGVQYGYLPYNYSAPARDSGPPARSRSSLYPAIPYAEFAAQEQQRASANRGYINVTVPTGNAKVWINGQLMTQAGKERSFMTPVLESTARMYSFDIRASWTDDFGTVTKQSAIQVRAGETKDVVFFSK